MKNKAIRFTAKWCGPCKTYAPIWDKVTKNNPEWEFQVIDVDEAEGEEKRLVFDEFKIMSIPTTIILKDEKEVYRKVGVLTEENLEEVLKTTYK